MYRISAQTIIGAPNNFSRALVYPLVKKGLVWEYWRNHGHDYLASSNGLKFMKSKRAIYCRSVNVQSVATAFA